MKRSDAILSLSEKLQKSQNLLDGYKNGSIDLKCLCDNLATRAVDYCDNELEMFPPQPKKIPMEKDIRVQFYIDNIDIPHWFVLGWEPEDEKE
jgi:hypothetical protein